MYTQTSGKNPSFESRAILLACALLASACGSSQDRGEAERKKAEEEPTAVGGGASTGGASVGGSNTASGGASSGGKGSGGKSSESGGAASGVGGAASGVGGVGGSSSGEERCADVALEWKSARKTNYTSYPDPGSVECVEFNGCMWAGWFAGCTDKQTEQWVEANNIAALFPGFDDYDGHQICIRSGDKTMIVNIIDTCADSDCSGCCSENQGQNDALVDLESFTNQRWGLSDGIIEWADLGLPTTPICD